MKIPQQNCFFPSELSSGKQRPCGLLTPQKCWGADVLPLMSVLGRVGLGCSLEERKSVWQHAVLSNSAKFDHNPCNESWCQRSRFLTHRLLRLCLHWEKLHAFPSVYWLKTRFWWNVFWLCKRHTGFSPIALWPILTVASKDGYLIPEKHCVWSHKITFRARNLYLPWFINYMYLYVVRIQATLQKFLTRVHLML